MESRAGGDTSVCGRRPSDGGEITSLESDTMLTYGTGVESDCKCGCRFERKSKPVAIIIFHRVYCDILVVTVKSMPILVLLLLSYFSRPILHLESVASVFK